MEESRGIASPPATVMAEELEAITHEAVRDPSELEWLSSIFDVDGQQHDSEAKHRIPKAPAKFREYEKDKKYFDPRVVSLGPYHHGEDHLEPMEKHKITALKEFVNVVISRNGGMAGIYEKFKELTRVLKKCYDAEVVANMSDDVFASMMFLDGCFVLHFIEKLNEGGRTMLEISNDLIPLIIRDMFLIENQLPFEVLDELMKLRWGYSSFGKQNIVEFIKGKVFIPMGFYPLINSSWSLNCLRALDGDRPLHLLDIFRTILLNFPPSNGPEMHSYRPLNFGSVMELKEIGIGFEKRRMESLMGISFKENLLFPQLLLPTMFINDTTISQLLNLTAFEAYSDTFSGCGVSSFILFMDSLINDDADVKMLRSKGILRHSLGSDDEVARLFNNWPADVMNDLKLYSDISMQILGYRDSGLKIFLATWLEKYFGRTYVAISFVSGSILLVLTAIQTYLTAFPRR